jgi:type VI secretion system secreted protein Hcp
MAVDMFFEIAPLEGETQDKVYKAKKAIDVLAWSWGMSNSGSTHEGSGGGSGKVNVQDISFTKYVDKASAPLMLACASGSHYKQAILTVRKAGGTPLEYIKITLNEIIVSAVSTGGSGGEDRLTENVTLNFAKVKFEYYMQDAKGGKETGGQMSWNIKENTKE